MMQALLNSIPNKSPKMPVLFIGHGSPMNGIEDNHHTRIWKQIAQDIPTPKSILIISAHWETTGTKIFAGEKPKMIYDMYGFPSDLYTVQYPVNGNPELAQEIVNNSKFASITPTLEWGLDHGAWSVLNVMFPEAKIPCFQMSLHKTRDLHWHYNLAKELAFLREKGVLIISSGNIVHNLQYITHMNQPATDWALEFDEYVEKQITNFDHKALIEYQKFGQAALISVNSAEHYIPLLYTLALQDKHEQVTFYNHTQRDTLLNVFMRSVKVG